jgi:hypothetical protein
MNMLATDLRFSMAPRFHLDGDWPARLQVEAAPAWRTPAAEELSRLTGSEPDGTICLFQIPEHLRLSFWKHLEQPPCPDAGQRLSFDRVVRQLYEFMAFKQFVLPVGARCDLVLSRKNSCDDELCGGINLADEPTAVVFTERSGLAGSVKVILAAGEGFRLPAQRSIRTSFPGNKETPDVLLLVNQV